ncbi:MAG: isoprenylcysteine carboxylmethyltransferase family protein [Pseudomonadota bacterium]
MTRWQMIDIPPVWLFAGLGCLWAEAALTGGVPVGSLGAWIGGGFVALGLALMAAALWAFWRADTTPIPHQQPDAMITTGIFAFTRNPIYLGDALVFAGVGLSNGAILTLIIVPGFVWLIDRRFIRAEEARLAAGFPETWPTYKHRVRRWI